MRGRILTDGGHVCFERLRIVGPGRRITEVQKEKPMLEGLKKRLSRGKTVEKLTYDPAEKQPVIRSIIRSRDSAFFISVFSVVLY